MKYDDNVECCANCKWLEQIPRNNRYGDTIIFVYILDIIVLEYTKIETKSDISLLVVES